MSEKEVKKMYQGITDISGDFLEEAQNTALRFKRPAWVKWGAVAACLCAAAGMFFWGQSVQRPSVDGDGQLVMQDKEDAGQKNDGNASLEDSSSTAAGDDEAGIRIPPMEIYLPSEGEESDMVGFFIYQGNCYTQYEWIEDADTGRIVGEYLGTASGTIDEWTSPDAYVELSGSIGGDFYAVKGMDPSFMLCMKRSGGAVETYICNSGITLATGADLFETRLHLSEYCQSVQFETRASWYYGSGEVYRLKDPKGEAAAEFIRALDAAEFMRTDEAMPADANVYPIDTALYQVYFGLEHGMSARIWICEDGYVLFPGIMEVCLKLPKEVFEHMVGLFQDADAGILEK